MSRLLTHDQSLKPKSIVILGSDISWSDNVIAALHEVCTKYALILLEDYIIDAQIHSAKIQDMLSLLETNRAAYIELWKDHYIFDIGFEKHRNY